MYVEKKREIVEKFARQQGDTGSPEVQVALMSERINELTEHFKVHKHDHHGRRGLMKLVAHRRGLLNYLKGSEPERYKKLIDNLGLRK